MQYSNTRGEGGKSLGIGFQQFSVVCWPDSLLGQPAYHVTDLHLLYIN